MVTQIQDPNTPKFNTVTGQPTDYGVSLGLTSPITIPKNLNTVSADKINNNNITTPPIVPVVADPNLTSSVNSVIANQTADEKRQAAIDKQQTDINSKLTDLYKVNTDLGNIGSSVDRTEENAARKLANSYATELEIMQRDSTKRIEDFKKSFGGTTQGADIIAQRMQREDLSAQADKALLLSAATRNYETFNAIAQQQIDNNMAVLKAKAENLKAYIDINKSDLDKKDLRLYNEQQKKLDAQIEKQTKVETSIADLKKNVALYAGNSAPTILSKLNEIDTTKPDAYDKAVLLAGKYSTDPLERELKSLQVQKAKQDLGGSNKLLSVTEAQAAGVPFGTTEAQLIAQGGKAKVADPQVLASSVDEIKKVNSLLNDKIGIATSAGTLRNDKILPPGYINRIRDWRANINNIIAKLTATELARIKGTGVTFGALSDGERQLVANAASVLSNGMIYKGSGDTKEATGRFKISEDLVKQSLAEIQKYAEIDFKKRNGIDYNDYLANPNILDNPIVDGYLNTVDGALQVTNNAYSQAGYDTKN